MIQRIQSIWLFLAALALILMLLLPFASTNLGSTGLEQSIYTFGTKVSAFGKPNMNLPLLIANIALAIICFINIFNFRNRSFQKRFAIVSILLIIGFAFWCSVYAKQLPGGIEGAHFGAGAYLPAIAILFIVLAIFGINKDERLIRSAERLR